ncbi:MAG: hypothetical protein KBF28_13985 [Gemmatimonadales bacterium]|nr:hypothetical protein [Gemmatimonadales bacterium]
MNDRRIVLATVLALALAACGEKTADGGNALGTDSLVPIADAPALDTSKPAPPPETVFVKTPPKTVVVRPAPTPPPSTPRPAPAPTPSNTATVTLVSGTTLSTVTLDSIHSEYTRVGDPIRVRVSSDVSSSTGRVIIPAGSVITLAVTAIGQANNRGEKGTLSLAGRSVEINGQSYPLTAAATDYEYEMKARGVGATDVARTGAGAAAGAIIGRVIGGKTGTIVGAVGGGAAGAAVAAKSANRDIIVHAGKAMTITLRDDFAK